MLRSSFHQVRSAVRVAIALGLVAAVACGIAAGWGGVAGVAVGLASMLGALAAAVLKSEAVVNRDLPRFRRIVGKWALLGVGVACLGLFWVVSVARSVPMWSIVAGVTAGVMGLLVGFSSRAGR